MPPVGASVVVPAHGRPQALAACLEALARQEPVPGGFEVVVVADGPEGREAIEAVAEAARVAPRLVAQEHAGPAAARNRGAREARGGWLAFTDDDCRPAPGWLRALGEGVAEGPEALVGGTIRNGLPANPFAAASQLVLDVSAEHFGHADDPARFFPSNCIALSRAAWERLGGFDAEGFPQAAAEDRDLADRALAAGLGLRSAPAAVIEHHHDLTLARLWRQHRNYGRGAAHFERVRARRGQARLTIAPGFHAKLALAPFRRRRGPAALVLALLTALTQLAYVAGYALERCRLGRG